MDKVIRGRLTETTGALGRFLEGLGVLGEGTIYKLGWFMTLLPEAHHMTPEQRVNASLRAIKNIATDVRRTYRDKALKLDGKTPEGGRARLLVAWWREKCQADLIETEEIMEVQESLFANGHATPGFVPDGVWGKESDASLDNLLELGS